MIIFRILNDFPSLHCISLVGSFQLENRAKAPTYEIRYKGTSEPPSQTRWASHVLGIEYGIVVCEWKANARVSVQENCEVYARKVLWQTLPYRPSTWRVQFLSTCMLFSESRAQVSYQCREHMQYRVTAYMERNFASMERVIASMKRTIAWVDRAIDPRDNESHEWQE